MKNRYWKRVAALALSGALVIGTCRLRKRYNGFFAGTAKPGREQRNGRAGSGNGRSGRGQRSKL